MGTSTQNSKLKTQNFKFLAAFMSGIFMGLTVAPVGAWFFAWFALTPLWVLVVKYCQNSQKNNSKSTPISKSQQGTHSKSLNLIPNSKKADVRFELEAAVKYSHAESKNKEKLFSLPPLNFYFLPLLWGIGYHGVALSWIFGLHPLTWLGVPWLGSVAIAFFSWSFITLWGAALVIAWASGMRIIAQATQKFPLFTLTQVILGTALWCLIESIWSAGPLWWSSLSYTQSSYNLVILHLGQLSGPKAVTAAIVAVNGLIAQGWMNRKGRESGERVSSLSSSFVSKMPFGFLNPYFSLATLLFISLHIIGWALYSQPISKTPETALKVGIVQGNIPNRTKFDYYGLRRAVQGYTSGYENLVAQGVDAVLTPEGALPFFSSDIKNSSLVTAVREKGVVAWIGGFAEQGRSRYTNSLFTFTGNGEIFSNYGKHKLVPLGEYVPFEEILGTIINRLSPVTAKQIPGKSNQIFETPFGRGIVGICYESAFPEVFRGQAAMGGEFILTASNNDPYSAAMQTQHHGQDTMRAIETDRWAARATNTGLSAFVDPHGKTLWISKHKTYETHAEIIYRRQTKTLYVRLGDWLTPSLLGLSVVLLLFQYRLKD
jgi:apolipoprotein N-acyltransferase